MFQSAKETDVEMNTWLKFEECAYESLGQAWPSDTDTQGGVLVKTCFLLHLDLKYGAVVPLLRCQTRNRMKHGSKLHVIS